MSYKVRLDTLTDVNEFVNIAASIPEKVTITDGAGLTVNAKSVLGVLHAMEFETLYCDSNADIYRKLNKFIVEG
jgi:hypothetical protein